ncbi:MAG: Mrp/NBP35 family ATP-binding protein [Sphingobium sp.]
MTDIDAISARLSVLSAGRASAPRLRESMLTLVLDVSGLAVSDRDAMVAAITNEFAGTPGIAAVRIAQTAEKHHLRIIAVASGKGGVGKSTVSANLAIALKRMGVRVGMVDADIYGPSQPRLMATEGQRPQAKDKQMLPIMSGTGIPMLSMGHLVEPGQAVAWRGSMAVNALGQMIDAKWDDVDVLVVDMPPGTGDVQLTMIQKHKPAGVVIVSTPQDLALMDASRAVHLFRQVNVPIIGLIENMAGYACPHCGEISDPFGLGGAQAAAAEMGTPFMGRIPLTIGIRSASDAGLPPAAGDGPDSAAFMAIGQAVKDWLDRN